MIGTKQHLYFATTILLFFLLTLSSVIHAHQEDANKPISRFGQRSVCGYPILAPEVTGGPYPWNTTLIRSNLAENVTGCPVQLNVQIIDVNTCTNLSNAAVEIWDATYDGKYSHYDGNSNSTFLRGVQITDDAGAVSFATLFPGSYQGRTVHYHLRVHYEGYLYLNNTYTGGRIVHTGQLFFNDTLTDLVLATEPYSTHTVTRTYNSNDGIFSENGEYMILNTEYVNSADITQGLVASITLVINSSATAGDTNVVGNTGGNGGGPSGQGPPTTQSSVTPSKSIAVLLTPSASLSVGASSSNSAAASVVVVSEPGLVSSSSSDSSTSTIVASDNNLDTSASASRFNSWLSLFA